MKKKYLIENVTELVLISKSSKKLREKEKKEKYKSSNIRKYFDACSLKRIDFLVTSITKICIVSI